MRKLSTAIIITGLVAGTMDILAACIQFYSKTGKGPVGIFNYIASALIGKEAHSGNIMWSGMGLLMHYMLAFGWTILFFILYPKISFLRGNRIVVGILYGVFVWTMMSQVLVPMTLINPGPFSLSGALQACAIIIVCIGLPISILANKHFHSKNNAAN